ncbi:MAG TPA: hypothetical protein VK942_10515, partial [Actinomycetes bacterium]|nr:hypothetical protein [Actinomycetes bacterium]
MLLRLRCLLIRIAADERGRRFGGTLEDPGCHVQADLDVAGGPLIHVGRVATGDELPAQVLECRLVKPSHYGRRAAFEEPSQIVQLRRVY